MNFGLAKSTQSSSPPQILAYENSGRKKNRLNTEEKRIDATASGERQGLLSNDGLQLAPRDRRRRVA